MARSASILWFEKYFRQEWLFSIKCKELFRGVWVVGQIRFHSRVKETFNV